MWCAEVKAKDNITLDGLSLLKGHKITITKGIGDKYTLWHNRGIYELHESFVGETIRIISNE